MKAYTLLVEHPHHILSWLGWILFQCEGLTYAKLPLLQLIIKTVT